MKTNQCPLQKFCAMSLAAVISFFCLRAGAASHLVTSLLDNAAGGTLRDKVTAALVDGDPVSTIAFNIPANQLPGVITLVNGQMNLNANKTLVIIGLGATNLTIVNSGGRIFHVTQGTTVISNLTFTGTFTGANGADGTLNSIHGVDGSTANGGAILEESIGTLLYFYNCSFQTCQAKGGKGGNAYSPISGNPANGGLGGGAVGGAICNSGGNLFLFSCTFSGNFALGGTGGTGYRTGSGGTGGNVLGGALADIYGGTDIVIVNCTFAGNIANGGKGGTGGAAVQAQGDMTGGPGGNGGNSRGGGIYVLQGCDGCTGTIHTTVSQNMSVNGIGGAGGAGPVVGTPGTDGTAYGGGMYFAGSGNAGNTLPINNTIVANNLTQPTTVIGNGEDVKGNFASGGYNLIGNTEDSSGWKTPAENPPDLTGSPTSVLDAKLGPLQNNGGQLLTMAPLSCSPAIDFGTTGGFSSDEIGQTRPIIITSSPVAGRGSDIGAYELLSYPTDRTTVLNIVKNTTGGTVRVSWPASSCLVLQQTADLAHPMWVNTPNAVVVNNGFNEVLIAHDQSTLFFSLNRP
jgi:hypothetical protein